MKARLQASVYVICAVLLALALAGTALGQASKTATELPLLSSSNIQELMAPGLQLLACQLSSPDTVGAAHRYIMDGAEMHESLWQANTGIRPPGLETLPEFKVANNASSAKDTPAASSIVTSTKSGTN